MLFRFAERRGWSRSAAQEGSHLHYLLRPQRGGRQKEFQLTKLCVSLPPRTVLCSSKLKDITVFPLLQIKEINSR